MTLNELYKWDVGYKLHHLLIGRYDIIAFNDKTKSKTVRIPYVMFIQMSMTEVLLFACTSVVMCYTLCNVYSGLMDVYLIISFSLSEPLLP